MAAHIGLVGLAVMGENLALNMESKGFTVGVYNRTTARVESFLNGRGKGKKFIGCHTIAELAKNLQKPRMVMFMVRAGPPVDELIAQIIPHLEKGDILIDGGNSHFPDTNRRVRELKEKGFHFVGTGVSGGEEGALHGPSLMPGGSAAAWPHLKPIFQAICAKTEDGSPCCDWVGEEGSGHFVKMVHNGIEYGDMQLIAEAYHSLKNLAGLNNEELHEVFKTWNEGDLNSYLIEITSSILKKKDSEHPEKYLVDYIVDSAGQKGTGKWTAIGALDMGVPLTLIAEAVFARCLSSLLEERKEASAVLPGPKEEKFEGNKKEFVDSVRDGLFASKIISYAQGYMMMQAAAKEYNWNLNYGGIALMWRGGCIIRSWFLGKIKEAFDKNPNLHNLLLDSWFTEKIGKCQKGWRQVVSVAAAHGIPAPAMMSALAFYDGYRSARVPANLIQAQRDYFGAHTYERVDKPKGQFFHTDWTGFGGSTASTTYNA